LLPAGQPGPPGHCPGASEPCSPALGEATWRTQSEKRVVSPLLKEIHAKRRRVVAENFS